MGVIAIEKLATELAKAIKETEAFANLSAAQARIQLDPAAQDLIGQMEENAQYIQQAQMNGQAVDREIEQIQQLQQKAMQNATLKNLFEAQQAFSREMEKVNQIINQELSS